MDAAEIKAAAEKEANIRAAQDYANKMGLVCQYLDAELQLRVPLAQFQIEILVSLLANCSVRENMKTEEIVQKYRAKVMGNHRLMKASVALDEDPPSVVVTD